MSYSNKTYRINTKVGVDNNSNEINLNLNVLQKYDILEILSLKLNTEGVYRAHTSGYGCVVGRVLANGGVGVPNAKISIFIESNENTSVDEVLHALYPFKTTRTTGSNGVRYNLLPDEKVSECHQIIGTFPNKRLVLDDKNVLEVFENYYKFTTITNESGDYMLFGVPTGNQMLHMDLDLSDIGFLSQKPVDMKYKGYNKTLFENPQQFKTDVRLDNLVQVISQSSPINVKPFWGEDTGEELGITRHDIDVNYKFEPTCIFMGSMVSDQNTDGFSKKCVPSRNMGRMENLTAGHGTIEMIRKKIDGTVEDYPIMGNELIDENGVWCYQIPMNLDYIITDEYGNLVPTNNPEKGIPTRTRVRFRLSKSDYEGASNTSHLPKILIPNNPQTANITDNHYVFGTETEDESYRDLFWNNVYSVKSFIPRIQMGQNVNSEKFSGIKNVNINEGKNPIPYNNMRVNLTFSFVLQCTIIKALIRMVQITNAFMIGIKGILKKENCKCLTIGDGMCPDLEGWYFAPGCKDVGNDDRNFITNTINNIRDNEDEDEKSVAYQNKDDDEKICLTTKIDYFMQCLEINLALENRVIQFDFYNDWINGLVYIPRWYMDIRKKTTFFFKMFTVKSRVYACTTENFLNSRRYVQQCSLEYKGSTFENMRLTSPIGCGNKKQKCHKKSGRKSVKIFGENKGGIIKRQKTIKGQDVYYLKPCENVNEKKCNLYATDIILLGNINKCNIYGIPSVFDEMPSSTYQLPPVLLQTNMPSDGPLYGSNGFNKCSSNKKVDGVTPIEQNFTAYEKWSMNEEKIDDKTEYAVAEISGIDWGVNLGPKINDYSGIFNPGGHFLSIGCGNAKVNIKSCTNLSRVCELGVTLSQRQAIPSYKENVDGTNTLTYEYLAPTGLISKDEIIDNNFRKIFATLNHNRLATKQNKYGQQEYVFTPLQPNNFNGDLYGRVVYKKYNDNLENNTIINPYAYIRDLEFNSIDYQLFRFGINNIKDKINNKFLFKNGSSYFLPVYENSFYFYYGLKKGATALDIFLSEYYAKCPSRGESITPGIIIKVNDEVICNEKSNILISTKNIPTPFNYKLFKGDEIIDIKNNYGLTKINITGLSSGEYTIEVENSKIGGSIEKDFIVNEKLPESEDSNFYANSCFMSLTSFNETPTVIFNENEKVFNNTPKDNGGTITLTLPKYDGTKKAPYVLGFAITCNEYCICYNNKLDGSKAMNIDMNSSLVYNTLLKHTNYEYIWLKNSIKIVNSEEELYNISENTINILYDENNMKVTLTGWQNDSVFNFYVCYSCDRFAAINPTMLLVDSGIIGVNNRKMSYYINSEDITLSEIDINSSKEILKKIDDNEERIVKFNYDNLNALTPYQEWSIKRALYFDESIYNGGIGEIKYGAIGGTEPYQETIIGTAEYLNNYDNLMMIEDVNTSIEGSIFPINLNNIEIPTIPWIDEITDENGYVYKKQPYNITITDLNGVVPYMSIKEVFKCNK